VLSGAVRGKWIGVDVDGTLADDSELLPDTRSIGRPIPRMVARVRAWLACGIEVRIVTARVAGPYTEGFNEADQRKRVQAWCAEHVVVVLAVQANKDFLMHALYDDRAVRILRNTGLLG
jgi:hypothetical protein